jgi:hypothetical protein
MSLLLSRCGTAGAEVCEYLAVWTESITQMLTQIAEVSLTLETMLVPPAEVQPPHEHGLQVMVVAAGSLRGEVSLAGATNCRSRRRTAISARTP